MNNTLFRIRITLGLGSGRYERAAYVAKRDGAHTWDGSWYTERELDQIKTWKTRGGAERWLAERPAIVSHNAPVVEQVSVVEGEVLRDGSCWTDEAFALCERRGLSRTDRCEIESQATLNRVGAITSFVVKKFIR